MKEFITLQNPTDSCILNILSFLAPFVRVSCSVQGNIVVFEQTIHGSTSITSFPRSKVISRTCSSIHISPTSASETSSYYTI